MKISSKMMIILLLLLTRYSQADMGVGLGIGIMNNGFGVNLNKTDEDSLSYFGMGCLGFTHSAEGRDVSGECGVGVGYISTELFSGNQHAVGLGGGFNKGIADKGGGYCSYCQYPR